MTNVEMAVTRREVNEAYAYLMSVASKIDDEFLYDKLVKERDWFCRSLDRYYMDNKTSGISK